MSIGLLDTPIRCVTPPPHYIGSRGALIPLKNQCGTIITLIYRVLFRFGQNCHRPI